MQKRSEKPLDIYGMPISKKTRRKGKRLAQRFAKRYGADKKTAFPLRACDNAVLGPIFGLKEVVSNDTDEAIDYEKSVFIGTIRMGYGHYRIGMALASAARAKGFVPCWLDLLSFDSAGARMIRDMDKWYSRGSRLSQKSRLFNNLLWDPLMGKWYKRFERNYPIVEASAMLADVHREIPPDTPFLATHPFNAHGALHAGLKRVVNVVPDNCPLGFHLAPGALHTVQSPSAYFILRTLRGLGDENVAVQGMSPEQVQLTGHYVDHELASNIHEDCDARLARIARDAPRRLLISIGGAGAQQQLLVKILNHLMPQIRARKLALFLNCGDHRNALAYFGKKVTGFKQLAIHHTEWPEMETFAATARKSAVSGLHVFCHDNPFAAVYATNMLMRAADILLTKPSELAYYPIPKLLLQRVGGHEAWGAIRAAEIGDGTPECTGAPFTLRALDALLTEGDLLALYCSQIKRLHDQGIYDGAYRAVDLATGLAV